MTRTAADWMLCVVDAYGGNERLALSIERSVRLAIVDRIDQFAEGRYVSPQLLADPRFVGELQRLTWNLRFRRLRKDWQTHDDRDADAWYSRIDSRLAAMLLDLSRFVRRPVSRAEAEERWTPPVVDRVAWLLRWEAKIALATRTARDQALALDEAEQDYRIDELDPDVSISELEGLAAYWKREANRLREEQTFSDAYVNQLVAIEGEL